VIVGGSSSFSGDRAFRWTSGGGMVDLNTYLPTLGIDLSGWTLREARGLSADGLNIVGQGIHNNLNEAWVAHIPEPSTLALLALGALPVLRRCGHRRDGCTTSLRLAL
jgi:probable HAF family extracellular repeat protein